MTQKYPPRKNPRSPQSPPDPRSRLGAHLPTTNPNQSRPERPDLPSRCHTRHYLPTHPRSIHRTFLRTTSIDNQIRPLTRASVDERAAFSTALEAFGIASDKSMESSQRRTRLPPPHRAHNPCNKSNPAQQLLCGLRRRPHLSMISQEVHKRTQSLA